MAAALLRREAGSGANIDSAGVYEGGLDPFVEMVMKEVDIPMESHEPKTLGDVDLSNVDVVIALTAEAAVEVRKLIPRESIEFWNIANPSNERGGRDAIIASYQRVRDELSAKLRHRFPELHENP